MEIVWMLIVLTNATEALSLFGRLQQEREDV